MINSLRESPLKFGTVIAALVCAAPLFWRQIPNMSMLVYPIVLVAVSWGAGWTVSKYVETSDTTTRTYGQQALIFAACLGLGFFSAWAAALILEVAGNIWRGNIRDSNLIFGLLSLLAGLWAAYSTRLVDKSRDLPSIILAVGVAGLLIAVVWSGAIYDLPDFSLIEHLDSAYARAEYVVYGLFEAAYWRFLLPAAFAISLLFRLVLEKSA